MKLIASRTAQWPLVASIALAFNSWVTDSVDLSSKTLGSTVAASTDPTQPGLVGPVANTITFDAIALPVGAVITGGEVIVEAAYAGSTAATLSIGKAGALTLLANAIDLKAAGRTALTLSDVSQLGFQDGSNVRLTLTYTVANATAGKVRVRLTYTVDGRANEVQIT